jgi:hypothetical protein
MSQVGRPRFVVDLHQHWLDLDCLRAQGGNGFRRAEKDTWVMETSGVSSLIHRDYYGIELANRVNAEAGVDRHR